MSAREIIDKLGMKRHPEGGWYIQTFVDEVSGARAKSTAIYYLLEAGGRSHWHRVDAAEIWHFYAGAPLELSTSPDGKWTEMLMLGADVLGGELPQIVVPTGHWQSAQSTGDWTLVGCTVAPGFEFSGFELAPDGWSPGS
jgi:hypothetical protein